MMNPLVVIPARFASSRFPGKALADLGGKTVLRRCYEQVRMIVEPEHIVVATDDDRIAEECRTHQMQFEITSESCLTGTDRVAEVATRRVSNWYVNVQGDEPFLDPQGLRAMLKATESASRDVSVLNAFSIITDENEFRSASVPKIVTDTSGKLLYVSRSAVPTDKSLKFLAAHRQVGMYAFRPEALDCFKRQSSKTPLEAIEDIEILRFLELGIPVQMIRVDAVGITIDTPEDLIRARRHLRVI